MLLLVILLLLGSRDSIVITLFLTFVETIQSSYLILQTLVSSITLDRSDNKSASALECVRGNKYRYRAKLSTRETLTSRKKLVCMDMDTYIAIY